MVDVLRACQLARQKGFAVAVKASRFQVQRVTVAKKTGKPTIQAVSDFVSASELLSVVSAL